MDRVFMEIESYSGLLMIIRTAFRHVARQVWLTVLLVLPPLNRLAAAISARTLASIELGSIITNAWLMVLDYDKWTPFQPSELPPAEAVASEEKSASRRGENYLGPFPRASLPSPGSAHPCVSSLRQGRSC